MTHRWKVNISPKAEAERDILKLPKKERGKVAVFLRGLVDDFPHHRLTSARLVGLHRGLWRYRLGDCRIICDLFDDRLAIRVVAVAHRKGVYTKKFH